VCRIGKIPLLFYFHLPVLEFDVNLNPHHLFTTTPICYYNTEPFRPTYQIHYSKTVVFEINFMEVIPCDIYIRWDILFVFIWVAMVYTHVFLSIWQQSLSAFLIIYWMIFHIMHSQTRDNHITIYPIGSLKYSSWSWTYGIWIYNYLCIQCLSLLKLWVQITLLTSCTWYNIMR